MIHEGIFWTEVDDTKKIPGELDLSKRWPKVVVRGEIFPLFSSVLNPGVIYGEVEKLGTVTLLDSTVTHEVFSTSGNMQTIAPRYVLSGRGVLAESGDSYAAVRVELTGLESWVEIPEFSIALTGQYVSVEGRVPDPESVEIGEGFGNISLFATHGTADSSPISVRAWRAVSLCVSDASPSSLDEVVDSYVEPLRTIVSICVDARVNVRAVYVQPSDMPGRWMRVFGPRVWDEIGSETSLAEPLFKFKDIGLAGLAGWIKLNPTISPLGELVVDAKFSSAATPSSGVLFQLASAIEGLHRRLYDDRARIDRGLAKTIRRSARKIFARFGPEVVNVLNDSLAFLSQVTYHQRLERIISEMHEINADIFGRRVDLWIKSVKVSRNRVAHQLHEGEDLSDSEKRVLAASLYWVLISLMIRESGINPQKIAEAFRENLVFQIFMRQAQTRMPEIYASESEDAESV
jgi:hypothetical protein